MRPTDPLRHAVRLPPRPGCTVDWPEWVPRDRARRVRRAAGVAAALAATRREAAELAHAGRARGGGDRHGVGQVAGLPAAGADRPARRTTGAAPPRCTSRPPRRWPPTSCGRSPRSGSRTCAAATYDGDTPRERARLGPRARRYVLTNPDMLHRSLLPGTPAGPAFLRRAALRRRRRVPRLPRRLRLARRATCCAGCGGSARAYGAAPDVRARLGDRRRARRRPRRG